MKSSNSLNQIAAAKGSSSSSSTMSRIQINDSKAGMENIDKDKINAIITKHSQNSRYYKKQQNKEIEIKAKAEEKLQKYFSLSKKDHDDALLMADAYIKNITARRDTTRIIVHIDMDAFYANVEIRDNPELKDKPMAVGSDSMLSTSNYVARKYGVRAAMPGFIAKELCPELVIVPCNFNKYRKDSADVMSIISSYDPNYSAMSLDEAYLDLTDYMKQRPEVGEENRTFLKDINSTETITFGTDYEECVREIRHRIYLKTQLTASAGIACNLRLAKLCSDINKPNGQYSLNRNPEEMLDFIRKMSIKKVNGIGPSTGIVLDTYGIKTCGDIYEKRSLIKLLESQNTFEFLMHVCTGIGSNRIEHDECKKSIGHETTFSNSSNKDELLEICQELSEYVSKELQDENLEAQKVNLKIKTINFEVFSRTKSLSFYTNDSQIIFKSAKFLLMNEFMINNDLKLRLIGVRVSGLREINNKRGENTIEKFFIMNKKSKKVVEEKEEEEYECDESFDCIDFKNELISKCPICEDLFEGNQEFIHQHIEFCIFK